MKILYCLQKKRVEYSIAASKITKGLANGRLLIIDLHSQISKYFNLFTIILSFVHSNSNHNEGHTLHKVQMDQTHSGSGRAASCM